MIVTDETAKYAEAAMMLRCIEKDWKDLAGVSHRESWKIWCGKNGIQWNDDPREVAKECESKVVKKRDATASEDARANREYDRCMKAILNNSK